MSRSATWPPWRRAKWSSTRHLLQLINDVLDLSKVEAGRMELHPERCRIEKLALEVRDVIRPLAEKKGLHLALEVPATLTANIDPGRFKQVLYDYLSNAVKFTAPGGSVTPVSYTHLRAHETRH